MTKEEAIERWADIAETVFWAEENIAQECHDRLSDAPNLNKKEQHKLAQDYCHAIAREILSKTTDEELNRWN